MSHVHSYILTADLIQSEFHEAHITSGNYPRLAKDEKYAMAIRDTWKKQQQQHWPDSAIQSETTQVSYTCTDSEDETTTLFGHVIRRRDNDPPSSTAPRIPGIIFFHSAAGPHDLFLLSMADYLLQEMNAVILIADLLSDETGWGWDADRTRYQTATAELLAEPGRLRKRVAAALEVLREWEGVDVAECGVAAAGWCFGGKPIVELIRMNVSDVKALASFHGVFGDVLSIASSNDSGLKSSCSVLVCHGNNDPFVSSDDVTRLSSFLNDSVGKENWMFMGFDDVRHGFTNPAQVHNPNPAFGYDDKAASESYNALVTLLKETLTTHNGAMI